MALNWYRLQCTMSNESNIVTADFSTRSIRVHEFIVRLLKTFLWCTFSPLQGIEPKLRSHKTGSVPFWYLWLTDPAPDRSCSFWQWPSSRQQKIIFSLSFYAFSFFKVPTVHLHHSSKIKNHKKKIQMVQDQGYSKFFCLLMEGSGSVQINYGSESRRPKNLWIRIRKHCFLVFETW
jgi:hypothetical protein